MVTSESIVRRLRVLKPELQARYKARRVSLFGSYARNEQTEASDVDLLVDFDEDATLFDIMRLEIFLEERLNQKVEVVSQRALRKELRDAVFGEAIAL